MKTTDELDSGNKQTFPGQQLLKTTILKTNVGKGKEIPVIQEKQKSPNKLIGSCKLFSIVTLNVYGFSSSIERCR